MKKEGKQSRWNGQTDTSDIYRDTSASDNLQRHLKKMESALISPQQNDITTPTNNSVVTDHEQKVKKK